MTGPFSPDRSALTFCEGIKIRRQLKSPKVTPETEVVGESLPKIESSERKDSAMQEHRSDSAKVTPETEVAGASLPKVESSERRISATQEDRSASAVALLVIASMAVAVVAYGAMVPRGDFDAPLLGDYSSFELRRAIWSVFLGIIYPAVGAVVVKFCELLRYVAHLGKIGRWSRDTALWFALVWPITLAICLFVYPCLFFIHLLF